MEDDFNFDPAKVFDDGQRRALQQIDDATEWTLDRLETIDSQDAQDLRTRLRSEPQSESDLPLSLSSVAHRLVSERSVDNDISTESALNHLEKLANVLGDIALIKAMQGKHKGLSTMAINLAEDSIRQYTIEFSGKSSHHALLHELLTEARVE